MSQGITFEPLDELVTYGAVTESVTSYEGLEDILVTTLPDDLGLTSYAMYRSMSEIEARAKQGYSLLTDEEVENPRKYAWLKGEAKCKLTYEWAAPLIGKQFRYTVFYFKVPPLRGLVSSVLFTHVDYHIHSVELLHAEDKPRFHNTNGIPSRLMPMTAGRFSLRFQFAETVEMMDNDEGEYYLRVCAPSERFLQWFEFDASFGFTVVNNNFLFALREKRNRPTMRRVVTCVSSVARMIAGWDIDLELLLDLYDDVDKTGDHESQINQLGRLLGKRFLEKRSEDDNKYFLRNDSVSDQFVERIQWYASSKARRLISTPLFHF